MYINKVQYYPTKGNEIQLKFYGYVDNFEMFLSFYITKLNLSENNLSFIPTSIVKLACLQELCLSKNNIYKISEWIGNLRNLRKLHLDSNKIVCLPAFLEAMPNLIFLDVYDNQIDETYCNFISFQCLDVALNYIEEPDTENYLSQKQSLRENLDYIRIDKCKNFCYSDEEDEFDNDSSCKNHEIIPFEGTEEEYWDCDDDDAWTPESINLPRPNHFFAFDNFIERLMIQGHFCPQDIHPNKIPKTTWKNFDELGQFDDSSD